jgi:hypothetical protein
VVRHGEAEGEPLLMDVDLMEQALHGLLHNAVDASPEGGEITLSSQQRGGTMLVTIDDQGPGMRTPRPVRGQGLSGPWRLTGVRDRCAGRYPRAHYPAIGDAGARDPMSPREGPLRTPDPEPLTHRGSASW